MQQLFQPWKKFVGQFLLRKLDLTIDANKQISCTNCQVSFFVHFENVPKMLSVACRNIILKSLLSHIAHCLSFEQLLFYGEGACPLQHEEPDFCSVLC